MVYTLKIYWKALLFTGVILLFAQLLLAQSVNQDSFAQYKVTYWTTDDGLPGNSCVKIFQDKDGFLWMGSFDGLVRFDGTRFITFNKANLLSSNFALAITGDAGGNLWVGTDHGLSHYYKGKMTDLADADHRFFIESMLMDEERNKVWIGTRNAGFFCYDISTKHYEKIRGVKDDDIINDIVKDTDGSLWLAGESGLLQYVNGEWKKFGEEDGLLNAEIKTIALDNDGSLYIGTTSGLFVRNRDGNFSELKKFKDTLINRVKIDPNGGLWVGTVYGLHQQKGNDWICFSRENGLSNNDVREIYFDADSSIWLGTYRGGVNQLRTTEFSWYFGKEDQQIEAAGALALLDENTILVGTTEGELFTVKNREVKKIQTKTVIKQRIYSLLVDNKKNIWAASYDGLLLITPDGKEKLFTERDGLMTKQIRVIFQDKLYNYWIGTRSAGLIKMRFDRMPLKPIFEQFRHDELSKVNSTFVMDLREDSHGNLLVCSNNGGFTIVPPHGEPVNYNKAEGLQSNTVFSVREDEDTTLWLTTTDGLTRLKNGKLFTFTRKDGMPHENPMDVMEDHLGYFWMPTQKGNIRVSRQQLNDYADSKISVIDWKLFDKNNDLIKSECTGTARALKDSNGLLWFPMVGGLISVDPSTIRIRKNVPSVYIEKVSVDDSEKDFGETIIVESSDQRVAFNYIALTLRYPNSAYYKYRLKNFDKGWIDAGVTRQAIYTNLPAGEYTFSVISSSNNGAWNTAGASVSIVVKPKIYQTWWFISLMLISLSLCAYIYVRVHTNSVKKRSKYLEQLIQERTRLVAQQRDELVALNEELRSSQEEVMAQRDSLADKIEELAEKNDEIERMNATLERTIEERTNTLEEQSRQISNYIFINAHKLRAPLASILGLINLMSHEAQTEEQNRINKHLLESAAALDKVIRSISRMLEGEFTEDSEDSNDAKGGD